MAGIETPSRYTFDLDGTTRVFYIPTLLKGENYCRVEVDDTIINDRSKYDIVNNSIVFIDEADVPDGSTLDVLVVQSEEAIGQLGLTSNIDIVAQNIGIFTTLNDNITDVNTVANNITDVVTVSDSVNNVNITADNIGSINTVANAIDTGTDIGGGSGGQYHGNGIIKGIEYFAATSVSTDDITIANGTNALSVESFTIEDGASVTVESGATWKVV